MTTSQLNTTNNSSIQATAQDLQLANGSNVGASTGSGGVQPGTTEALLDNHDGVPLNATLLSTVSLGSSPSLSTSSTSLGVPLTTSKHHVNLAFVSLAGLLILMAVLMFFLSKRSVKSTT